MPAPSKIYLKLDYWLTKSDQASTELWVFRFVPKGHLIIAHRFIGGIAGSVHQVPKGRLKDLYNGGFSVVPLGLPEQHILFPAVNCWAIYHGVPLGLKTDLYRLSVVRFRFQICHSVSMNWMFMRRTRSALM